MTIGGMANTVREVQTLSMPATMLQLVVFLLAELWAGAAGHVGRENWPKCFRSVRLVNATLGVMPPNIRR